MSATWQLRIAAAIRLPRKVVSPCPSPSICWGEGLCWPEEKIWVPQTTFPSTSEKERQHMGFLLFQTNVGAQGWRGGTADETLCCQA